MRALPKGYLLQVGDVVLILATVKYVVLADEPGVHVTIPGHYNSIRTNLDNVQGIHHHFIEVGSQVVLNDAEGKPYASIYSVVAIHGELAWIKTDDNVNCIANITSLTPYVAPAKPEVPEPAEEPINPANGLGKLANGLAELAQEP